MIKAGIIGGAGYTGGEILRLILNHPSVEITFIQSESQFGKPVYETHQDVYGSTELKFVKEPDLNVDVIFLCKGHHESRSFLEKHVVPQKTKIIDLSQDFRHNENKNWSKREFVYGLPELNKERIRTADSIANPGCFATAIQLSLLPLAKGGLLKGAIHIHASTGSTGAGQSLSSTTHFTWRNNNHSSYKEMEHQHEKEIHESISQLSATPYELNFIPMRGAFTRGIHCISYLEIKEELNDLKDLYQSFYRSEPFTHLTNFEVDLKQVVNTNNCFLHLTKKKNKLIITAVLDNLLKGAAGQAIQNMNLMFGLSEKNGLLLKPLAY